MAPAQGAHHFRGVCEIADRRIPERPVRETAESGGDDGRRLPTRSDGQPRNRSRHSYRANYRAGKDPISEHPESETSQDFIFLRIKDFFIAKMKHVVKETKKRNDETIRAKTPLSDCLQYECVKCSVVE